MEAQLAVAVERLFQFFLEGRIGQQPRGLDHVRQVPAGHQARVLVHLVGHIVSRAIQRHHAAHGVHRQPGGAEGDPAGWLEAERDQLFLWLPVALGTLIVPLDSSVNIAFPAITQAFGLPVPAIQWVVVSYVLTYGSLLLATSDLDGTFEKIQAGDVEVVQEPTEQPYGVRDCAVRDPAGNLIRIQELR